MMLRHLSLAALALSGAGSAHGYTTYGTRWMAPTIPMQLQLGTASTPLADGSTSWGEVAEVALSAWNGHIEASRFTVVRESTAPKSGGNRYNNVFFSSSVYGDAWGSGVLAVTLIYSSSRSQTTECDVLFNSSLKWDSYRGPQRTSSGGTVFDFQRVALHEFGHVLGLDHPDQDGQAVVAMMNSRISNLDALARDDIAGAQSLYGVPAAATPATSAPTISTQPDGQTVRAGTTLRLSVAAAGSPAPTLQWLKDGAAIPGATTSSYSVAAAQAADAGSYTVRARNSVGEATSSPAVVTVTWAPQIATAPTPQTLAAGGQVTLSVAVSATPLPTYQWQKDGVSIPGATESTFTVRDAVPADAGTYSVVVSNSLGFVISPAATVDVAYSRLVNLSTRGAVPAGGALTAGFVVRGTGEKPLLVRGIGPSLAQLGVSNHLADPQLALIAQATTRALATVANWGGSTALSAAFEQVGAFALPPSSLDAAAQVNLSPADYTVRVSSENAAAGGIALTEVYDLDYRRSRAQLVNLSTLGHAGTGDQALIAGFSIQGNRDKRVLIRAVGPGLTAAFNLTGILENPRIAIHRPGQTTPLYQNDDWGGTTELRTVFSSLGAFALPTGSADAALQVSLPPGTYTVIVTGANNETGTALVEIYDAGVEE